jgi:hypothetical protein
MLREVQCGEGPEAPAPRHVSEPAPLAAAPKPAPQAAPASASDSPPEDPPPPTGPRRSHLRVVK